MADVLERRSRRNSERVRTTGHDDEFGFSAVCVRRLGLCFRVDSGQGGQSWAVRPRDAGRDVTPTLPGSPTSRVQPRAEPCGNDPAAQPARSHSTSAARSQFSGFAEKVLTRT
jgi:hypothetical protein